MAPTKTIYVKDADLPLWKRADVAANKWEHSDSVSSLVADALRLYFGQFGDKGGGLYVQPPDEGDVTFGEGITRSSSG